MSNDGTAWLWVSIGGRFDVVRGIVQPGSPDEPAYCGRFEGPAALLQHWLAAGWRVDSARASVMSGVDILRLTYAGSTAAQTPVPMAPLGDPR